LISLWESLVERVFAGIFAVVIVGAGLSLDYYSAIRIDRDLGFKGYVDSRLEPLLGHSVFETSGLPPSPVSVVTTEDAGATDSADAGTAGGVSSMRAVGLALGALGGLGRAASGVQALPGEGMMASLAPGDLAAKAAGMMGTAPQAASDTTVVAPAESLAAGQSADASGGEPVERPKPGVLKPKGGTIMSNCATKAGTKFCSVAQD
jgi:hypothetical protein